MLIEGIKRSLDKETVNQWGLAIVLYLSTLLKI